MSSIKLRFNMSKKDVQHVLKMLKSEYGSSETALSYSTPHQMLVATILSAQCTDERVNKVTPGLFKKYKNVRDFAAAKQEELEQDVRSTGFFRNKAKNIIGASKKIVHDYKGAVPRKMSELLTLPGVARKTANVVLHNAYGIVDGIVVDTHVGRLARRLCWSKEKNAEKAEKDLMKIIPRDDWGNLAYLLIDHGRAVCNSRKPLCDKCVLKDLCPSAGKFDNEGKWIGVK